MDDRYDRAIEFLTRNPGDIYRCWSSANSDDEKTSLFLYATENGNNIDDRCGCLTQIRDVSDGYSLSVVYDRDTDLAIRLTGEIHNDERIPKKSEDITVDSLPVFAEWQRRLDVLIRSR